MIMSCCSEGTNHWWIGTRSLIFPKICKCWKSLFSHLIWSAIGFIKIFTNEILIDYYNWKVKSEPSGLSGIDEIHHHSP